MSECGGAAEVLNSKTSKNELFWPFWPIKVCPNKDLSPTKQGSMQGTKERKEVTVCNTRSLILNSLTHTMQKKNVFNFVLSGAVHLYWSALKELPLGHICSGGHHHHRVHFHWCPRVYYLIRYWCFKFSSFFKITYWNFIFAHSRYNILLFWTEQDKKEY